MSELQIGLLAIGIVVVVAVYVYGFWQQRQYRRKIGGAFQTDREDVLYSAVPRNATPQVETLIDEELAELEEMETHRIVVDDEICGLLDATTDYVISMTLHNPLTTLVLAPLWSRRFDFGKSVNACGQNAHTKRWERLIPESHPSYTAFKIGLQLADRTGAVSETRLVEFQMVLNEIAEQEQAEISHPSIEEAIEKAKDLDQFCLEVDQMIGLNILPGGDRLLFGSEIAQVAERHGMLLQADGSFHLLNEQGLTLFSLTNMDGSAFQHHTLTQTRVQGLTLLLDVPRVERPAHQFDEMAVLGRQLAMDLKSALVDDHRVALGDPAIANIREQVAAIEGQMLEGKVIAGSAQALRLFS
ncbi:MAG: cell division protein ZipA C-terminal FtsZ-binding domain-containing protein [Gallionellaceae bacterium]